MNKAGENVKYGSNLYLWKDTVGFNHRRDEVYLLGEEWRECSTKLGIEPDNYDEDWIYNIFRRCFTLDRVIFDSNTQQITRSLTALPIIGTRVI